MPAHAFPRALLLAALYVAPAAIADAEADVSISDLPMDDSCTASDEGCALSLRQLRGELSLKVAAVEASNSTDNAATQGGACIGQTGWDTDFAARSYRCGLKTMGSAWWAGRCMARWQGVPQACGRCMGDLIHCGLKCVRPCCYGKCYETEKCVACGVEHCHQPFIACAGVKPP